ncbi:MAG TPA: DUF397 domain-containing protein [Streptosporangiaceae bacterium]|nr:DUF397 domain-containing protein [Streptosporangiaceae bacterium]
MNWRKSSYSGSNGAQCVEVAAVPESADIAARDSKQPTGPHLRFSRTEWRAFLTGVKADRYDLS